MHRLIASSCLYTINHFDGGNHGQAQSGSERCPDGERTSAVPSFKFKTFMSKQQQEKPTETCLTPLPSTTAGLPASMDGKSVLSVPRPHLCPFSSVQLSSPCDAVKPPASSTPQAMADTPGPLQATHAWNPNIMPCDESIK